MVLGSLTETRVKPPASIKSAETPWNVPEGVIVSVKVTRSLAAGVVSDAVKDFVHVGDSITVTWLPELNGVAVVDPLVALILINGGL